MKKCPFCGAEIEDSARFCLYCMESLEEKEQVLLTRKKGHRMALILAIIAVLSISVIFALMIMRKGPSVNLETGPAVLGSFGTTESSQSESVAPATAESTVGETTTPPTTEPSTLAATVPTTPMATDPAHVHDYRLENTEDVYLKETATCQGPAVYYYSCSCGQKGTATFTYGRTGKHVPEIVPEIPATCTQNGKTEGKICSVCKDTLIDVTTIECRGHTYALGYAPSPCLKCGEMGTVAMHPLNLPIIYMDKFQLDSFTFSVLPQSATSDKYYVWLYFTCTNITSETQFINIDASLYSDVLGYSVSGTQYGIGYLEPGKSRTIMFSFSAPISENTLIVNFRDYEKREYIQ